MPAVTKVPLGASTLVRKWYLDVNSGTHAAPTWVGVFGVEDFKAPKNPTIQDDSDYDSSGWKSSTVTALEWSIELKLARKTQAAAPTAYDVGQEFLRAKSDLQGIANQVEVRWYEMTSGGPKTEAYMGYATVSWVPDGGAMDALETVTVTLTGQGARTAITHPDGAQVVPVVYSITPATGPAAGGTLCIITGTGFFKAGVNDVVATTGIKFAAISAAGKWIVEDDNHIAVITPAVTASTVSVKVTNSAGDSVTMPSFIFT